MKKLIISALTLMLIGNTYAETEKIVKSEIDEVTVFLQGAQIHRKSKIYIDKGTTKVIVEGIARDFNPNSIQVKGKGSFIIMDVSSRLFYPTPEPVKTEGIPDKILKEISLLQDSIQDKNWELSAITSKIQVYESEKSILLTSGVIKGQTSNDSIAALKDAMTYLRDKMIEINSLLLGAQKSQNGIQTKINQMNNRLSTLQNYNINTANNSKPKNMDPVQQVIVTVSSNEPTSGYLELSYMVYDAGWSPAYDLRADDISSPVKLTYKANVYQHTGIDWKDVNVTLSTINPNRSNTKPTLAPWYINYYQPVSYPTYGGGAYNQPQLDDGYDLNEVATESAPTSIRADKKDYASKMPEAQHLSNFTQMQETMAMVEFELKLSQTIPSDGQNHMMAVKSENIESTFEHFIVPKLDNDAFLVAHMTGWEELNLLPAVANIYYDGTYVGQTRINPSVMSDTLDLALGRDRGIYVTRKKTDDVEKVKALSSEKIKTVTYEIAIKNYKSSEVNLTIEDQIPVSNLEDIKVEMGENSDAEYNKDKGYLIWERSIKSKETQKFKFSYTLKYDKDKQLALN